MLKLNLTKFKSYITELNWTRKINIYPKKSKQMKFFYKHLIVNSVYLKKQKIIKYICKDYIQIKGIKLNSNVCFSIKIKDNKIKSPTLIWLFNTILLKNNYIKSVYCDFWSLFTPLFTTYNYNNFYQYWLLPFFSPTIKTRSFYFTNNIKFFLNQRLVKQPILILYNKTNKDNKYSNYLRLFKGLASKKNLNSMFFFKSIFFQITIKENTASYFFRHNNFLKKFVTQTYLKLLPA